MGLAETTKVTTGSAGVSTMWSMYLAIGYQQLKLKQLYLSIVSRDAAVQDKSANNVQIKSPKRPSWVLTMSYPAKLSMHSYR